MPQARPQLMYALADFADAQAVRCPCGWARRVFGDLPASPLSLHRVEIELDARTHYHVDHTEVYYFLECDADAKMELDGELVPVRAGMSVYIPPGVRHRAVGRMKILNIVLPAFDEADEHFD